MNCPAISIAGETSVSGSLQAMDCQIEQSVEVGYNRLFGAGGAFAETLTVLLTIYVALLAYGFLTGRTRLTVAMMSPRLVTMALVITFVTVWPAYHTIFYGLFMYGPDQVASALLGQSGSAVMNFAQVLDGLFVRFADIAQSLENSPGTGISATASMSMPVVLFWLSGLILLVTTLGLLILTRLHPFSPARPGAAVHRSGVVQSDPRTVQWLAEDVHRFRVGADADRVGRNRGVNTIRSAPELYRVGSRECRKGGPADSRAIHGVARLCRLSGHPDVGCRILGEGLAGGLAR